MSGQIYIHYGHKAFDLSTFEQAKNRYYPWNKPVGGLWASPVDAKRGWKEWNEAECFVECKEEESFKFCLSDCAKVYHIYSKEDVERLPLRESDTLATRLDPDFEQIMGMGYDAIEYHLSDEKKPKDWNEGLYWVLYGWDCDSILVLNPGVVVPLENFPKNQKRHIEREETTK